ncbi:MAG: MYXO-CTERM sorting domain-containing protein [Phycisphaerales bacterium JB060]
MHASRTPGLVRAAFFVLSVAGLAAATAPARAQSIQIDIADATLFPGESTTITLSASYGAGDYAVAGIATEVVDLLGRGGFSDLQLIAPMDGPGTSAGSVAAGGIEGIIAGQLNVPPAGIYADPTSPIAFWSMTFTVGDIGTREILDLETRTTRFDVYPDMTRALSESRLDELTEGRGSILLVPTPGSAAVLGLGLLAIGRRRR